LESSNDSHRFAFHPRLLMKLVPSLLRILALAILSVSALPAEETTETLPPAQANFSPGPEYADSVRMFQGIPGIERAANGRLWATWYGGGTGEDRYNYIMLVTSEDDGRTWSSLKLVLDPDRDGPVRAFDPCLWHDPSGRLWLFWAERGNSQMPQLFAIHTGNSGDANPKWSATERITDGIMMNKPIVTKDGAWLLPTALWKREGSSRVVCSTDRGKTWELIGSSTVPNPAERNCDENMIVQRQDGSLWMLVRTGYGIGETTSTDGGKTWTEVMRSSIPHAASRFFIRRLGSGKLLLVRHNSPDTKTRSHLTAYLSDDDGKTWKGGLLLDERKGVSYPDGIQSKDGVIRVIYDFDRYREKKIFMAEFMENDVLAGKPSDSTRLQVLVNQATGVKPPDAKKAKAAPAPPTASPKSGEAKPISPTLITQPGPEFSHATRKWQGIPSIEISPGGRLWATWYGGPAGEGEGGNHQTLVTSGDDGRTWSDPVSVFMPEPADKARCGDGHLWLDPKGRLWWVVNRLLKDDTSELGPRTSWAFINERPDKATPKWSEPILLGPGVSLNKQLVLSNGEWITPLDNFSASASTTDPKFTKGGKVYASTDQGKTWNYRASVEIPDVTFAEHMFAERRDGSLWMLARTSYGIAQSTSTDKGLTWSRGEPFTRDMNVNTRFFLRKLKSGRVLVVVNDDPKTRRQLTAMLSDDDGRSFPHKLLLDERKTSYPDGTQAADGSLYIIYDQERYTRGAQQILFAKVTEEDILAGKVVSPASRLAQKINRLADFGGGIDDQWQKEEKVRAAARAQKRGKKKDDASPVLDTPEKLEASLKGSEISATGKEPREFTNSLGMKMIRIESGSFLMGQDGPPADYQTVKHAERCDQADWDERPAHRVTITKSLHFGMTEVTNAQYRQFKPKANPKGGDDEAAINVSWNDAVEFFAWLSKKEGKSYRLPTEAEWEYACRSGTTTLFHTGDRLPDGFQKWKFNEKLIKRFFPKTGKFPSDYRDWPAEAPLRVAQTPANAWGLFDMHGNVEEWCQDWYGPYEADAQTDPVGRVDGDFRITRGGSHTDFTRMLRSANRSGRPPETMSDRIGFRVVMGETPKTPARPLPPPPLNARDVVQSQPSKVERINSPFFSGPNPFVKVPPDQAGPMFSGHNHSPSIAECPNGDLLAVWFSCGDEGGAELAVSASRLRRGASQWEEASPFWDGPDINDHAPKLWFDGDRTLFFFAKGMAGDIVRTSTDSGATWSKARVIQPEAEIGNTPIRTHDGALMMPLDGVGVLNVSRDGGQTWNFTPSHGKPDFRAGGSGTRLPGIHNAIAQLKDGRLMAFGRYDLPAEQEKFNFRTPLSYSSDGGKTWTYEAGEFPAIGSVQRAVLLRLHEGPLLFCSFTDEQRYWPKHKGMMFKAADGSEFSGYGLFAAVSFDEGKTWPVRKLVTPGGAERMVPGVDKREFALSDTLAEAAAYLSVCQTRDDLIQLVSSKNHYVFNLAWLKKLPRLGK